MSLIETIKDHPIPAVAGVFGLLFLVSLLRPSSSAQVDNTGTIIAASLQSQSLAGQTNVAISGINADVTKRAADAYAYMYTQGVGVAADMAKTRATTDAAMYTALLVSADQQSSMLSQSRVAMAGIQSGMYMADTERDVQMSAIQSNRLISFNKSSTEIALLKAAIGGQIEMQDRMYVGEANLANITGRYELAGLQTQAQHAENIVNISTGADLELARLSTLSDQHIFGASVARDIAIANINDSNTTKLADIGRQNTESLARIESTRQIDLAGIDASGSLDRLRETNSGSLNLATTTAAYNLDVARTQYASSDYQAGLSANVANKQTSAAKTTGIVGSILGTLGFIFSDSRLKERIVFLGVDDDGQRIYEWSYRHDGVRYRGPMASEVKAKKPSSVMTIFGHDAIVGGAR